MKRLLTLIAIFVVILSIATPAVAQDGTTTPDRLEMNENTLFLPLVTRLTPSYTLTGQVKDAQDVPVAGATVMNEFGQSGVTDVNGVYQLPVPAGERTIVAAKEDYAFEPGVAELNVTANMNNLNFTALSKADQASLAACTNLLLNPNFEDVTGWTISPANNPSKYVQLPSYPVFSPVWSMLSGWPLGETNTYPNQFTTSEFWQPVTIPAAATTVRLQMRVLPRSADYWGYHIAEQAAMDAAMDLNAPEATESQYAHIRDAANTTTLRQLFKWFPIHSYYWLYRSYDLMDFRGQTIGVLFGAAENGDGWNTSLYVDDVYLYYCVP